MARRLIRYLCVLLLSAAAAWCAWRYVPSSPVDRYLVRSIAGATANPPFIIGGSGTHQDPWTLRILAPNRTASAANQPIVVSLGDDPEGIFQTSPPSPVDIAIVLRNMRRLGAENIAVSAVLAWEEPETIALAAVDSELSRFQSVVTAAPLSRGAAGQALPPSFRRASLSPDQIRGEISAIPVANRISLPHVILGGDNTLSGFSILENEPAGNPLLACWDDRIVLAFPLAAVISSHGLPFDQVEVDLGNFIRLGPQGPIIPIDAFGRLSTQSRTPGPSLLFSATSLIDATDPLPTEKAKLTLLRDDQSSAEPSTRIFSSKVAPLIADIASSAGMSGVTRYRRLPATSELTVLAGIILLLTGISGRPRLPREIIILCLLFLAVASHTIVAGSGTWLPTLPAIAALLPAFLVNRLFDRPETPALPVSSPAPAAPEPATPPATPSEPPAQPKPSKARPPAAPQKKPAVKKSPHRKKRPGSK